MRAINDISHFCIHPLQEVIERASSLANVLNGELQESTNNLLEVVKLAGANEARNEAVKQNSGTLPEKVITHIMVLGDSDSQIDDLKLSPHPSDGNTKISRKLYVWFQLMLSKHPMCLGSRLIELIQLSCKYSNI